MRKIWHCVKKQIDYHQRIRQRHVVFLGQGIEIDVWPRQKKGAGGSSGEIMAGD